MPSVKSQVSYGILLETERVTPLMGHVQLHAIHRNYHFGTLVIQFLSNEKLERRGLSSFSSSYQSSINEKGERL
jgi:hypothetical protein